MIIKLSKNPENEKIERDFNFENLETNLKSFAKLKGFVKQTIEKEINGEKLKVTPIGMNPNGEYFELVADDSTRLNPETGEYLTKEEIEREEKSIGEFSYIKEMKVINIAYMLNKDIKEINILDVLNALVQMSVTKQDKKERFDK